ncbi:hypothetical protein ARMSODRAFT_899206, partial [Armillaria solidipes]
LNVALCTSYTLFVPWVHSILQDCILKNYDFGTAYTHLRPFWHNNLTTMADDVPKHEGQMLQDVLVNDRIVGSDLPPRCVWDLFSNRVVPWWPWGISHAWMDEVDREDVLTPINGYEWPVPTPKNTNLDNIRIEMLNLGAEYVWLDVLCLRQKGGIREDLREEEWKVDVPTIGSVYRKAARVVCYLSGLGLPLSSDADNLESDRCWFRRAWTLQEISCNPIIGGDTGDECLLPWFEKQLSSLQRTWTLKNRHVYDVLSEMRKRVSTNPVDKVAGLVHLFSSESIPIYDAEQSEEDAWAALVDTMHSLLQKDLLFVYPGPGNGLKRWRPSWKQVMTETLPSTRRPLKAPWIDWWPN